MTVADYDGQEAPHGPALVMTTRFLRKGPRRVALRTQALAIPGTYELSKVIGAGLGLFVGLFAGAPFFAITGSWLFFVVFATFGALGGIFVVSWSPLKGESILKWFVLHTAKRNKLIAHGGGYVRAYVGGAVVNRSLFSQAQMVRSYVEASPGNSSPTNASGSSHVDQKAAKKGRKNKKVKNKRAPVAPTEALDAIASQGLPTQLPVTAPAPMPQGSPGMSSPYGGGSPIPPPPPPSVIPPPPQARR